MPRVALDEDRDRVEAVWERLRAMQGQCFVTAKGLPFTYAIRGGELFVDRKNKSITIATVAAALRHIDARLAAGESITGPKKIGCHGASYLYPLFLELGLFPPPQSIQMQLDDFT